MPETPQEPKAAGKRPPVAGTVLTALLDEIVSGRVAPGDSLPSEATLSRRFGVSRTALREAMRYLAAHGLVESRTRAGTTVLPRERWNRFDTAILHAQQRTAPHAGTIAELREAIFFLMPRAAALAAERASAAEVAGIERALSAPRDLTRDGAAFYASVLEASGNWVFAQMGRLLSVALERPGNPAREGGDADERATRWQKALLEAVRLQRADEARNAMKKLVGGLRSEFS